MNTDYINMPEVDVAYKILTATGEPLHYKNLITDVIDKKHKSVQSMAVAISEIYTMIDMDSRFQHRGKGMWGLTEWNPPEVKRSGSRSASKASPAKSDNNVREEDEI